MADDEKTFDELSDEGVLCIALYQNIFFYEASLSYIEALYSEDAERQLEVLSKRYLAPAVLFASLRSEETNNSEVIQKVFNKISNTSLLQSAVNEACDERITQLFKEQTDIQFNIEAMAYQKRKLFIALRCVSKHDQEELKQEIAYAEEILNNVEGVEVSDLTSDSVENRIAAFSVLSSYYNSRIESLREKAVSDSGIIYPTILFTQNKLQERVRSLIRFEEMDLSRLEQS